MVPKAIRDRLGLAGGETLEIDEHDGVIEVRVAPIRVELVEVDGTIIAKPLEDVDPIDDATVRSIRDHLRR